jgi:hypothetical protein
MAAEILERVAEPPALIAPLPAATCIGSQPEPVRGLCVERAPWPNSFHVKQVIAVGHDRGALRVRAADVLTLLGEPSREPKAGTCRNERRLAVIHAHAVASALLGRVPCYPRRIAIAQQSLGSG